MPDRKNSLSPDRVSDPPALVFLSVRFVLFGFDPLDYDTYRDEIVGGGGIHVERYDSTCTHVIVDQLTRDHPVCAGALRDGKIVVTKLWVDHSTIDKKLADASRSLYMPVKDVNGIPGAKQLVICLTGYQKNERAEIEEMVEMMGAKFMKILDAKIVTHLICYKFEGQKYLAARKYGIIVVNHRWLEDSLSAWSLVPEDEYRKSSWELEIMDTEVQDSDEEEKPRDCSKLAEQRNLVTDDRGLQSKMNGTYLHTVALGGVSQVRNTVIAVPGSLSTSPNVLTDDRLFSTPMKSNLGGTVKMSNDANVGVSLSEGNDITASHILEKAASGGIESENIVGLDGGNKDHYETKFPDETISTDASGKRNISMSFSRALQKSTVSSSLEAASAMSNTLQATRVSKKLVCEEKDQVVLDKTIDCSAVDVPPSGACVEATVCTASYSEAASCYGVSSHEPILRLDCSDGNPLSILEITSGKTDEDAATDPSMKKLLSFKRNPLKQHVSSSASPIDETDSPVQKVSYLHGNAMLSTSSDRIDVANMSSLDNCLKKIEGSPQMDCKNVTVKLLRSKEIEFELNQSNMKASELLIPLSAHGDKIKESGVVEGLQCSNQKSSFENCHNAEHAPKCDNVNADIKGCLASSSSLNRKLKAKKFTSRTTNNYGNPFKLKLDLISSGIANQAADNVQERPGMVAPVTMGETQENATVSVSTIPKSQNIYKRSALSIVHKSSDKITQLAEVLDECNTNAKDMEIKSVKKEDQRAAYENHQTRQSSQKELVNREHVSGFERMKGKKKKKICPASNEFNSKHEDLKNVKSEVLKPSNKLKRKSEVIDGNDMVTLDKEKQNKLKQQYGDAVAKQSSKTTTSKAKNTNLMHPNKENQNHVNQQADDDNQIQPIKNMVSTARKVSVHHNVYLKNESRKMVPMIMRLEPRWFILSGHRFQRKEFNQAIKCLHGRICRDSHQWCYQATHFIVPEPVRRTEKFFAAAAAGRWILKTDYLTASSQAGKFLEEEPFEWYSTGFSMDGAINMEAARKWRLLRQKTGHGAFYGMKIIIYGECIAPSLDTLKRVTKAGDGIILATSPPYHRFLNTGVDFAIVSPGMPRTDPWIREFIAHEVPCVLADYLVEFVCKPGYSLDRHVLYNMHASAEKSHNNLLKKLEEVVKVASEDDDILCSVCHSGERGDVMLICGDDAGKAGCGLAMHIDCCDPPIESVPEDDWFCSKCHCTSHNKNNKSLSVLKSK